MITWPVAVSPPLMSTKDLNGIFADDSAPSQCVMTRGEFVLGDRPMFFHQHLPEGTVGAARDLMVLGYLSECSQNMQTASLALPMPEPAEQDNCKATSHPLCARIMSFVSVQRRRPASNKKYGKRTLLRNPAYPHRIVPSFPRGTSRRMSPQNRAFASGPKSR